MDEKHPKGFACGIRFASRCYISDNSIIIPLMYWIDERLSSLCSLQDNCIQEVFLCKKSENSMQIPLWN